jgi:hypothetical protein
MKKIKAYFKKLFLSAITDKVFLESIIPILENLSKSTKNNIDDTLINLLKKEIENMSGDSLYSYTDKK